VAVLLLALACRSSERAPADGEGAAAPHSASRAAAAAFSEARERRTIEAGAHLEDAARSAERPEHSRPGFFTAERDGRLWVFRNEDMHLYWFLEQGEPAHSVTWIGAGPHGVTLRGPDRDTLVAYLAQRPGFRVVARDDRLYVLRAGGPELSAYFDRGVLPEDVTLIGAGPRGETLRGGERDTLLAYAAHKPGFEVEAVDGRLWVFEPGADELAALRAGREPAERVTFVGAGPMGLTVCGIEKDTLSRYLYARAGFHTEVQELGDRSILWVLREDAAELDELAERGDLAQSVTWIGAGPDGITLRSSDADVLRAYLDGR